MNQYISDPLSLNDPKKNRNNSFTLNTLAEVNQSNIQRQTLLPIRYGSEGYDAQQDYLIKGYLPCRALTCFYGASSSYKSFLAIDWVCRVATGIKLDR